MLELSQYEGIEKGNKIKEIRQMLIQDFAARSKLPAKTLKGKSLKRIFWSIVYKDNLDEIREKIIKLI